MNTESIDLFKDREASIQYIKQRCEEEGISLNTLTKYFVQNKFLKSFNPRLEAMNIEKLFAVARSINSLIRHLKGNK